VGRKGGLEPGTNTPYTVAGAGWSLSGCVFALCSSFLPCLDPLSFVVAVSRFFLLSLFFLLAPPCSLCGCDPGALACALRLLLRRPGFGPTSSFFSSFSFSLSYLSTPCHNLGTFARLDSLPFLFDGLGLAGCHLGMLLILECSRILNLSLFFHRMRLCTDIHTSMRLYARKGIEIVKSKIRGNLSFRLFAFLRWLFRRNVPDSQRGHYMPVFTHWSS